MPITITKRNKQEENAERVVTGFHSLDWSLSDMGLHYGLPLRSIVEITGAHSIGKSTIAFSLAGIVAHALKRNITLIDFERQNPDTLTSCLELAGFGGQVDWASYIEEEQAKKKDDVKSERILDISTKKCYEPNPDVIIIDSIAAFTPTAMHEGELGDANMGIRAKTIKAWFLRTLKPLLSNAQPNVVFYTNHLYPIVGGFRPSMNSPVPMDSAGGTAVGYLSTQSIDLKKLFGFEYPEQGGWALEGKIAKNRDGFGKESKKSFYVYVQAGEGISKNLTAVLDCYMYDLAKSSATKITDSSTITLDGQNMGKFRDLIASRHNDEIFLPFHNALKAVTGGIKEVSTAIGE
jgi:RecA/RadA recombinase